jgi:hypothetical protein
MSTYCFGNGGPFYFENVLKHSENDWRGYRLFYLEPVGGSLDLTGEKYRNWYELTYVVKEETDDLIRKIVLMPQGSDQLYGYSDIIFAKKYKEDDEIWEKFLVFNQKRLNKGPLLILIPKFEDLAPIKNITRIAVTQNSLPFIRHHPPDKIQLSLKDSFDMTGDNMPDILVFNASNEGYTRTYILKRVDADWHIIHIHYPR